MSKHAENKRDFRFSLVAASIGILLSGFLVSAQAAGPWTITFNSNYGTPTTTTQSVVDQSTTALALNTFTRSDYYFVEWNTLADGSGDAWHDGATNPNTWTADQTFYAQWLPVTTLNFSNGRLNESGQYATREYQWVTGTDNGYGWDNPIAVDSFIDYYNVTRLDGNQVDARVTFVRHFSSVEDSSNVDVLDQLDNDANFGDDEKNEWINIRPDFNRDVVGQQDPFVEIKIEFFRNLLQSPSSPTPVTIPSFDVSIYDIDGSQFVSIPGSTGVFLAPADTTHLTASAETIDGVAHVRVQSPEEDTDGSDGTAYNVGRATYRMPALQTMTLRVGVLPEAGGDDDSSANFNLDFSLNGLGWGNNVTPVQQSAQAIVAASAPTPAAYTGPLPVSLSSTCVPAAGGVAILTGERLNTITSAEVDGKTVTISDVTATSVKLTIPALAAGTYSVVYNSSSGRLTHQDSLKVCATAGATPPTVTPGAGTPFQVQKRFTGYRGDRGPVVARDLAAITRFIQDNPGLKTVTCQGSTSGVPALSSDPALARARAENACRIVSQLVPGITTRIAISTGKGTGQFFRAVTIFGRGERAN